MCVFKSLGRCIFLTNRFNLQLERVNLFFSPPSLQSSVYSAKESIWQMPLKMLLDSVKHHFSFWNPVQVVNRDDLNAENAIKDRTGQEINVSICKEREKKKDEPDIISMIYKHCIVPFISLVLRINCLNKFYYSKKQHK